MNPERWQQVRELLDRAIAASADERPALLETACAGDAELRSEVESLLRSHQQAGTEFLKKPALDVSVAVTDETPRLGRRVGVYRLIEKIGQGGMGDVYRAERADGQYDKQVAIKFVRAGLDTAAILDRFRNERQVLASLDHPNIARLIDGGTTEDGVPYLVMELIEGTPIDDYCDERKLAIPQRLHLFMQVCAAVQYAHQHLVIHRDIKPGNILVTGEGYPKLLDFGIAKLLDPAGGPEMTLTMAHPLTPEYASPEQVRGESITTATDVYSLGVVLYQLLTGNSPYPPRKTTAPHELARAICEYEPLRPSSIISRRVGAENTAATGAERLRLVGEVSPGKLRRRLAGDLDTIVMRAMHKEPLRRYVSVEQFSEDIRRHLVGLPVLARRDSWSYRAGKFLTRHKIGVAASAVILLAIAGGIGATIREARIADQNARRAEERFNDVRKLAKSLMFEIYDSIREVPGSTDARRLIATRALEYLDKVSGESKGDISLQKELAAAYERVGDVLGYPYSANLGDSAGALATYRKALAIRESLGAALPADVETQRDLVDIYYRMAQVFETIGKFSDALVYFGKAQVLSGRLASGNHDPILADHYAGTYYFTAMLQEKMGDVASALANYQRGAEIRKQALQFNPNNFWLRSHLLADSTGIARCLAAQKDLQHAIEIQARSTAGLQQLVNENPSNATLTEYLAEDIDQLAGYQKEQGDATAALNTYREAYKMFAGLAATDPKNSLARTNLAFANLGIGDCELKLGQTAAALKTFREAITALEEISPPSAANRYPRSGLTRAYASLGGTYLAMASAKGISHTQARGYWQEAHSACQESLTLWQEKEKRDELESGERGMSQGLSKCVADTEAKLRQY